MLTDTRLEDDLDDLLWSFVNLFHRKIGRIERDLDANEQAQRRSQLEQNGSEVRSVELERLIDQGVGLIECRNAFEFCRDHAAEHYEAITGSLWRPRSGSMVNHRALTSAMIDSREFIAAQRRAEAQLLVPAGSRIAFTGGADFNDHQRIWAALDKVHAKHPDMVLLHGGTPSCCRSRRPARRRPSPTAMETTTSSSPATSPSRASFVGGYHCPERPAAGRWSEAGRNGLSLGGDGR